MCGVHMKSRKVLKSISFTLLFIIILYSVTLVLLNFTSNSYLKYSFFSIKITAPSNAGMPVSDIEPLNKSMTINSDGSVTCNLYYWEYPSFQDELRSYAKESLQNLAIEEKYSAFLGVKFSSDLKEITLTVNEEKYSNNFGAADVCVCVYPAYLYRISCNDAIDNDIIIIHLLNQDGNSIGDYYYPSDFDLYEIFLNYFETAFSF